MANSSGVKRLKGIDEGVLTGVGSKDCVELLDDERVLEDPVDTSERYGGGRRASRSFSSCNRA